MSSVHFQSSDQGVKRQERRKTRKTDLLISNETFSSYIQTLWLTFKKMLRSSNSASGFLDHFFVKLKKLSSKWNFLNGTNLLLFL